MATHGSFFLFCYIIILSVFQLRAERSTSVTVTETASNGTVLLQRNETASCNVTSLDQSYIKFTDKNVLVISKPLDLEVLKDAKLTVNYTCGSIRKTLTINITPVNEFDPVFVRSPFYVKVKEEIAIGTQVLFLGDKCTDADKIKYGNVSVFGLHLFGITAFDGRGHFTIDNKTGSITTSTELDYENLPLRNYFVLNVSAQDDGGRITFTTVNITVEDIDDNSPEFRLASCRDTSQQCRVTEYSAITNRFYQGSLSIFPSRIFAIDRDTGINAEIVYTIESDHDMAMSIRINNITGEVEIVMPFANFTTWTDSDVLKNITLHVTATEVSTISHQTNISLTILIYRDLPTTTSLPMTTNTKSSTPTTAANNRKTESQIDPILLVEIVVPICLVIVLVIFVICMIRSRKRRQRDTRYKLTESQRLEKIRKSKQNEHENIDVISSTPINPYELINMYARMDSDRNSKEGSSKSSKTEDDASTAKESAHYNKNENIMNLHSETTGKDVDLYAKVRIPRKRQKHTMSFLNDAFDNIEQVENEGDFTVSERDTGDDSALTVCDDNLRERSMEISDTEAETGHNYVNTEDVREFLE